MINDYMFEKLLCIYLQYFVYCRVYNLAEKELSVKTGIRITLYCCKITVHKYGFERKRHAVAYFL